MTHPSITLPDFPVSTPALGARVRDVALGLVAGLDLVLWNYTMASLIFAGALSGHLRIGAGVVLSGAALMMVVATLRSSYDTHVLVVDEQAVAVLATVAVLVNARLADFASSDAAAATMFVIMACVTLAVGACLHLSVRFNASTLLQLVPFPVVCGFLGGLGWLLFGAGVSMLTGHGLAPASLPAILEMSSLARLLPAVVGGVVIFAALRRSRHFLLLPGLLLAYVVAFYVVAFGLGAEMSDLRGTWLFDTGDAAAAKGLRDLDFRNVNFGFIASVAPEMATMVALSVLGVSINLTGLEVASRKTLPLDQELRALGSANLASGLLMGLPALTEIVASVTYRKVGARSRVFMVVLAACCAAAVFGGTWLIAYLPKVVMGALVFFAATQFLGDWLIGAARKLSRAEATVVWSIFGATAVFGFMAGIALGIALASLLFVVRYSRIDIVASTFTLRERGSFVDRPARDMALLSELGAGVRAFNLRGFLFFGTASAFFEQLKTECGSRECHSERSEETRIDAGGVAPSSAVDRIASQSAVRPSHLIVNFQRVTGIDSTVVETFGRIDVFLESRGIVPVYCGMSAAVATAFDRNRGESSSRQHCETLDAALKWTEEALLSRGRVAEPPRPIRAILADALGDPEKGDRLAAAMERIPLRAGDYLFHQGDEDTSVYVIERGAVEVRLEGADGTATVLREFRQGTVIGEMANYSDCRTRSASAVVVEPAIVHRLGSDRLAALGAEAAACQAILHEFTARVLVSRLTFMNKRLALDV